MSEVINKKDEFHIYVYSNFDSEKPDHTFIAKSKREVVGLMKTVMDNFNPAHVDIMSKKKFYDLDDQQTMLNELGDNEWK